MHLFSPWQWLSKLTSSSSSLHGKAFEWIRCSAHASFVSSSLLIWLKENVVFIVCVVPCCLRIVTLIMSSHILSDKTSLHIVLSCYMRICWQSILLHKCILLCISCMASARQHLALHSMSLLCISVLLFLSSTGFPCKTARNGVFGTDKHCPLHQCYILF